MVSSPSQERASANKAVLRKSITQRHKGSFPVVVYNLGLKKILIQSCIGVRKQLVYELPSNQSFVNFIEFNNLDDIGFYPGNLRIQCCSVFAFLTQSTTSQNMNVNLLIVDPYYSDIQIAIFKSTKLISLPTHKKYQDIVIKSVMYSTRKNQNDTDFKVQLVT